MTAYDMGDLRSYVRTDNTGMQARAESTVLLGVSHSNLKLTKFLEIRLDCHMSIERVKEKLMAHTGTSAAASRLTLKDCAGNAVAEMNDDSKKLGFYSPQNGWVICIMDTDEYSLSLNGGLDDVTNVKKYEMSDEDYERRDNTYRAFKAKKLAADPTWTLEKEMAGRNPASAAALAAKEATRIDDTYGQAEAACMATGNRCEIAGGRRGVVMYVGPIPEMPIGWWIGVKLDEPLGKNDGSVKGARYFTCDPAYGCFIRPQNVQVGDYPEEDIFADEI